MNLSAHIAETQVTGKQAPDRSVTRAKRRRIVMIAPHFEEYALHLCMALAEDADVLLALNLDRLHKDYEGRPFPATPGITFHDTRFESPLDGLRLFKTVIAFRPETIHLQEASGLRKALICAALVALTRPFCRIALTVHDPSPHEGRDAVIAQRLDRYRRFVRRAAQVVFVHGDYCRKRYLDVRENQSQSVVVIDHGEILGERPTALPDPKARPLSIFGFGRMEAYKGLHIFLDALKLLHARSVVPTVVLAGSGPEMDRLEGEFAAMPGVTVDNAFITSERLIEEMAATDLVVMPYLSATQSGVLAATLANRRFVVASGVGGIPDIVEDGHNGLLVPPGDPAALADALERVARDPALRQHLSDGAAQTASERLAWSQIVPKMLAQY